MINLDKHIYEGWKVSDFIEELEPLVSMIMNNESFIRPFKDKETLKNWCKENQPYYKKEIPDVVEYFAEKYNIK